MQTVREDLCFEAIRLALLLSEHPEGEKPKTHALLALLCFHAARLSGRMDDDGIRSTRNWEISGYHDWL
jgi:predicted RNA polymerase sigma factor